MKVLKSLFVQLFTGANIVTILLLWACCLFTYISPAAHPRLALLTLTFPAFLLVNVLFILFWLVFKVKRVWIPLVGLMACASFVRDYLPLNIFTKGKAVEDSTLSILTYNTHSFGGAEAVQEDGTNIVCNYLANSNADIICLQESSNKQDFTDEMVGKGYEFAFRKEFLLYSRLHIIEVDTLALEGKPCHAMRALLQDGSDTLMLLSVHLQSNLLSPEMKEAYREALRKHESDSLSKELSPIVQLLSAALPQRAAQADSIASIVASWLPKPVILCGDFNDTPISYTHRVLTRQLASAYRQSGNGLGFTFHEKGFPVRIDHILFDGHTWESSSSQVVKHITCSDHFPIRTKLRRKQP